MTVNPRDVSWMGAALCAQTDPDEFHSDGPGGNHVAAKRVCKRCPVRRACLEFALANDLVYHGVWGGFAPRQLRAIKNDREEAREEERGDAA